MRNFAIGERTSPALVVDEICEPLRAPLLREVLELLQLAARERLRRNEVAHRLGVREHPELRVARERGRVLDLQTEAEVGLVGAVAQHRVGIRHARERPRRRRPAERLERRDDDLLEDVEHLLARRKRELEVELAELELPVCTEILVPPRSRDLVVAVEPADHEELLEELGRLGERVEPPGLQAHRDEEVAGALRRAERHRWSPHVDEALLFHRTPDRTDDRCGEAQVALHAVAAQVEVAVAKADGLLDAFVVDLERQRLGARDDLELVHLQLDFARRDVRVHGVGRPAHDFALRTHDELGTDVVRDLRRLRGAFGVHHELHDARVVTEVDEDETAVVSPARDPPCHGELLTDVIGTDVAGIQVAPDAHPEILSTSSSSDAVTSGRPDSRTVAWPPFTITVQPGAEAPGLGELSLDRPAGVVHVRPEPAPP